MYAKAPAVEGELDGALTIDENLMSETGRCSWSGFFEHLFEKYPQPPTLARQAGAPELKMIELSTICATLQR